MNGLGSGFGEMLLVLFVFGCIGIVSTLAGLVYLIYWLVNHVVIV